MTWFLPSDFEEVNDHEGTFEQAQDFIAFTANKKIDSWIMVADKKAKRLVELQPKTKFEAHLLDCLRGLMLSLGRCKTESSRLESALRDEMVWACGDFDECKYTPEEIETKIAEIKSTTGADPGAASVQMDVGWRMNAGD